MGGFASCITGRYFKAARQLVKHRRGHPVASPVQQVGLANKEPGGRFSHENMLDRPEIALLAVAEFEVGVDVSAVPGLVRGESRTCPVGKENGVRGAVMLADVPGAKRVDLEGLIRLTGSDRSV